MINGDYIMIVAPDDWPGFRYRHRYCYEHHYVYWQNTGHMKTNEEVIHHKDENKHNNAFSNLEILHRKTHASYHNRQRGRSFTLFRCPVCKGLFERETRQSHLHKPKYKSSCCSRDCAAKMANNIFDISNNVVRTYKKNSIK